jgi:hypothetical protein
MSFRLFTLRLLLLALLVAPLGCGRFTRSYAIHSRETSWSTFSEKAVPGIDSASVTCIIATVDGVSQKFIVWSDLGDGGSVTSSNGVHGATFRGKHTSQGGQVVEILAEVGDEKPLTLKVNGTVHDMTKGRVLLVKATVDPPQVRQLDLDPVQFEKTRGDLKELALSIDPIREFYDASPVEKAGEKAAGNP